MLQLILKLIYVSGSPITNFKSNVNNDQSFLCGATLVSYITAMPAKPYLFNELPKFINAADHENCLDC